MRKLSKLLAVVLVVTLVCACTAGASAFSWEDMLKFDDNMESIGEFYETYFTQLGDFAESHYEELAESFISGDTSFTDFTDGIVTVSHQIMEAASAAGVAGVTGSDASVPAGGVIGVLKSVFG